MKREGLAAKIDDKREIFAYHYDDKSYGFRFQNGDAVQYLRVSHEGFMALVDLVIALQDQPLPTESDSNE